MNTWISVTYSGKHTTSRNIIREDIWWDFTNLLYLCILMDRKILEDFYVAGSDIC